MKVLFYTVMFCIIFVGCTSTSTEDVILEKSDYMAIGDSIANIAQHTLLYNVGNAMKNGGPVNAIQFCNINALRLTDSLSTANKVKISRITRKARNPKNRATELELMLLAELENNSIADTLIEGLNDRTYYKTIRTGMPTCLKCHGTTDADIDEATLDKLKALYPKDEATNYSMGEFRGAWKIVFEE